MQISSGGILPKQVAPQRSAVEQPLKRLLFMEVLRHSGLGDSAGLASGGIGEEHFSSFLVSEYADILAQNLNIKLGKKFT